MGSSGGEEDRSKDGEAECRAACGNPTAQSDSSSFLADRVDRNFRRAPSSEWELSAKSALLVSRVPVSSTFSRADSTSRPTRIHRWALRVQALVRTATDRSSPEAWGFRTQNSEIGGGSKQG